MTRKGLLLTERKVLESGIIPGHCARCGAAPSEWCIDYEYRKGRDVEVYYCLREFDTKTSHFFSDGHYYSSDGLTIASQDRVQMCQQYSSFWEYIPKAEQHLDWWVRWYRGRFMVQKNMTWWTIWPCPFRIEKQVFVTDVASRQLYVVDADNIALLEAKTQQREVEQLSFFDEGAM